MARAYVGLGANLGDAAATIAAALRELAALPATSLLAQSPRYRTAPVDAGGPDYVNAVAVLETALDAEALLAALLAIERRYGRVRSTRNAPRTLDLDLLAFDMRVIATARLTLPHPRLHERAFVLVPLLDVAPDLELPGLGRLAERLPGVAGQRIERLPD